jgi:general secretion pathway protein M
MTRKLTIWFDGLSQRERILVMIASMLASGAIIVFGFALPLLDAIDNRRQEYLFALEGRTRIESRIAAINAAMDNAKAAPTDSNTPLQMLISQSGAEAGFVLDRADAEATDTVDITMAHARPQALMAWLNQWENRGINIRQLNIKAATDGTVSVTASLTRPAQ